VSETNNRKYYQLQVVSFQLLTPADTCLQFMLCFCSI